jgi:hypothetical protein
MGIWNLFGICYLPARHLSGGGLGIYKNLRLNFI